MLGMKVFISWSGDTSRQVAEALRDWLPDVIQQLEPFLSSKDIASGLKWQDEISSKLDETTFGVICLTKDNRLFVPEVGVTTRRLREDPYAGDGGTTMVQECRR